MNGQLYSSQTPDAFVSHVRPLPNPNGHLQAGDTRDGRARSPSGSGASHNDGRFRTPHNGQSSLGPSVRSPRSPYVPLPPNTFCTASSDHDSFSIVQLAGASSPASVKERIYAKLRIPDDEQPACSIWLSRIGGDGRADTRLSDEELWTRCQDTANTALTILVRNAASSSGQPADYADGFDSAVTMAQHNSRHRATSRTSPQSARQPAAPYASQPQVSRPYTKPSPQGGSAFLSDRRDPAPLHVRRASDGNTREYGEGPRLPPASVAHPAPVPAPTQPVRRLPGTPVFTQDSSRSAHDRAAPGQSSAQPAWTTTTIPPGMLQTVRPLPQARPTHPDISATMPPSSGYNNLYFQNQYQVQGHTIEYTDPRLKQRNQDQGSRYPFTEQEIRSPPLPIANPLPQYRLQAQAALGITRTHPRPPPPPPLQTSFPNTSLRPAQPAIDRRTSFTSASDTGTRPFDPRVMRQDAPTQYRPAPVPPVPYLPNAPGKRADAASSATWQPSSALPQSHSKGQSTQTYQPLEAQNTWSARPGEILQPRTQDHRRPSDIATLVTSGRDTAARSQYAERRPSERLAEREREAIPSSLRPGAQDKRSPRDSGSSYTSSTTSRSNAERSRQATTASDTNSDAAYGGLDVLSTPQSPPSSVRSSTSASGPDTPATNRSSGDKFGSYSDVFDEDDEDDSDDDGTWLGPKRPPLESQKTDQAIISPTLLRQSSVPSIGGSTLRAGDNVGQEGWADSLLRSLSQEGTLPLTTSAESTLKGNEAGRIASVAASQAQKESPSSAVSQGSAFREDSRFYAPEKADKQKTDEAFSPTAFDDDPESATFFSGHGPPVTLSPFEEKSEPKPSPTASPSSRTSFGGMFRSKGRKPDLRVTIDQASPTEQSKDDAKSHSASSSPRPSSQPSESPTSLRRIGRMLRNSTSSAPKSSPEPLPSPALPRSRSGHFVRRGSFVEREKQERAWAVRPPVETVLEQLDVYFPDFPEQDLDKPVFEAPTPSGESGSATTSPVGPNKPDEATRTLSNDTASITSASERSSFQRPKSALNYRKSIRFVAGDRRQTILKANSRLSRVTAKVTAVRARAALLRRKSTKLFGSRIEEVTSDQMKQMDLSKPESLPDEDPENASFKWIKGDLIGRGTYGHVYFAMNVTLGEPMAVKQVELPKTRSAKEDERQQSMVASLKAEIELLKDLDHPNIVMYLGSQETPEHLSIFLEYVPGGSVGRIVRTHGKFEDNVIRFFTYQILDGLKYLHEQGILHRDLKADNILCDHDGICKISDFGTSKRSNSIYDNQADMSMQGSIFWMAPEVIQNAKQGYSAKADIWSLGCICLEMFAGRRPWSEEEAIQAMFKLGAERQAPPIPADVEMSDLARHFLGECLSVDATRRPRANQLLRHLYLELPEDWRFSQTALYRAIAEDEKPRSKRLTDVTTPTSHPTSIVTT